MGNPSEKATLRQKNQPSSVQISIPSTGWNGFSQSKTDEQKITIPLENINEQLTVQVGYTVTIRIDNNIFKVYWKGKRVGNIPQQFNTTVFHSKTKVGKIIVVVNSPSPIVVIELPKS